MFENDSWHNDLAAIAALVAWKGVSGVDSVDRTDKNANVRRSYNYLDNKRSSLITFQGKGVSRVESWFSP